MPYSDPSQGDWASRLSGPPLYVLGCWAATAVFWGLLVLLPKEDGGLAALGVLAMIIFVGFLASPFMMFSDDWEIALILLAATLVALVTVLILVGVFRKMHYLTAAGGILGISIAGYVLLFASLGEVARFP